MRKGMPETGEKIKTPDGLARVVDTNILENIIRVPSIMEEFVSYVTANASEMKYSRLTCCMLGLHYLLTVPGAQTVVTAMLIKMNWGIIPPEKYIVMMKKVAKIPLP